MFGSNMLRFDIQQKDMFILSKQLTIRSNGRCHDLMSIEFKVCTNMIIHVYLNICMKEVLADLCFLLDSLVAPKTLEPSGFFAIRTSERLGDALCSLVWHGRIGGAPCMES